MFFRIAAILLLCCLSPLFAAQVQAADSADEAAALFAGLRAAGAQLDPWSLIDIKSDEGSIRTEWRNPQSGAAVEVILQARNPEAPAYAMTRLYNVFASGQALSDEQAALLNGIVEYIRVHEGESSALLPYEDFRRLEELRRSEEKLKIQAEAQRREMLQHRSLNRLLPDGTQLRLPDDGIILFLLPLFVLMLLFSLYVSSTAQIYMSDAHSLFVRDITNYILPLLTPLHSWAALRNFAPETLQRLAASPLIPPGRPFDAVSNTLAYLLTGGGELGLIGAYVLVVSLYLVLINSLITLFFLFFSLRRRAIMAAVFTFSLPWFLLPFETLAPLLLFTWLFTLALTCAVVLVRSHDGNWRLSAILSVSVALSCLIHPLGLLPALYLPLAALFNIASSRDSAASVLNWLAWLVGALASALLLLVIQAYRPESAFGGIFAAGPADFAHNLLKLNFFDLSIGSLPHSLMLAAALIFMLRPGIDAEWRLAAMLFVAGALICAALPLDAQHPLLYGGLPALAGLTAAPTLYELWAYLKSQPLALRLAALLLTALLCAASPFAAAALS